jgi:hypothetical protein
MWTDPIPWWEIQIPMWEESFIASNRLTGSSWAKDEIAILLRWRFTVSVEINYQVK